MAIQSLTDLKALINSTIQDNTTNDISGSDVQTALINAIDTLDSLEGFINVHKANGQTTITAYGSKALARAAVPDDCKKEGVVIAYKISTGWLIEQNLDATAGTWGDDASWQTIGPVSVSQNTSTGQIEISVGGDNVAIDEVKAENETNSGHLEIKVGNVLHNAVNTPEIYGGKLFNASATALDNAYTTIGNWYSICGVPKGIKITSFSFLAPVTSYFPTLVIGKAGVDKVTIIEEIQLPKGDSENYKTITLNKYYDEDVILFVNAFYFKALATTMRVPYIITYNGVYSGQGTVDLGLSVNVEIEGVKEQVGLNSATLNSEIPLYGSIASGSITSGGLVAADTPSRTLYFAKVREGSNVVVSSGDLYGFFEVVPIAGVISIDGERHIEALDNTIINIPLGCSYLAVRGQSEPTFSYKNLGLLQRVSTLEGNEILNIEKVASDIAMFENIGFCGDSYAAGMIVVSENPTVTAENPNLSWGKVLQRTHGINASLFAKGGTSVVDVSPINPNYLTDSACLPALLAASAQNLYVISLGHNDCYISAQDPSIYGKTWTKAEFLAEFETNYRSIISQISTHALGAKIILCMQSGPYAQMGWGTDINATIQAIGNDLGLPVLNPEDDKYLTSTIYFNTMVHSHPTFAGYAGMAKAFDRLFSKATVDYWDYFKGYTGL